jgi:hypothetical protein
VAAGAAGVILNCCSSAETVNLWLGADSRPACTR